ncbi:hypothetical protein Q1695_000192 [Nippostrongylus brasiliensis]|nr:hypothetical protein Q1695_000192 [Nippostrongylus brasiliensis]
MVGKYSILFLVLFSNEASTYKILVFAPKFGISHMKFMAKVADTLVEAGHDVVVYSPNVKPHVQKISTKAVAIDVDFGVSLDLSSAQRHVWSSNFSSYFELAKVVLKTNRDLIKALYNADELHDWVRDQKFDIAVSEGMGCFDALFYLLGIKKFILTPSTNPPELINEGLGIPNTPSFVPVNNKGFSVPMSYWDRAQNLFEYVVTSSLMRYMLLPEFNGYIDERFGKDVWSIQKQIEQTSYIFVNNDEFIDFPRVLTRKWHYIGGLKRQQPKPLTPEWENIFMSAERGVILISFGTMARSTEMGELRRSAFVKAFQAFPDITFIWRYENTTDNFCNASNIILHDWLPQVDMLNHKRMLAFITHAGMGGVFESAYAGVPVITIPLFADQLRNAHMMQHRGMGLIVDKDDITAERLITAIKEILQPKYSEAAHHLSEQLQNKPFSPEDVLVRHIEHAIRFNVTASLNNASTQMSVIQYYMLDIIVPFFLASAAIISVFIRILYNCFSFVLQKFLSITSVKVKQQ